MAKINHPFNKNGKEHPAYKNGSGKYYYKFRSIAIKLLGENCQICNNSKVIDIHHKDENPRNNPLDGSNWQVLCKSCHSKLHWLKKKGTPEEVKERNIQRRKLISFKYRKQRNKLITKEIFNNFGIKDFLNGKELSIKLGLTRQRINQLRSNEQIPYCKIGGNYFYPANFERKLIKNKFHYALPTYEI